MIGEHGGKAVKNAKDSLSKAVQDQQKKSICGRYSEAELIAQLKKIATNPCRPQFARNNIHSLCNQILTLRKVMVLKEMPWRKRKHPFVFLQRKRKLDQFFKDSPSAPSSLVLLNKQDSTKMRRQLSNASSVSYVLNSFDSTLFQDEKSFFDSHTTSCLTYDDTLPEKQESTKWPSQHYKVIWNDLAEDISPTVDTNESANDSDPSLENTSPNDAWCVEINDTIHHSNSLSKGAQKRHLQPSRQSIGLLSLIGDHLQTKVIPVGPRFQADIPEWSDTLSRSMLLLAYKKNLDNSKRLGTRVWPIKRNVKATGKTIGKGFLKSCCCASPGSIGCVERHVSEKRLLLQRELGPAFFSWRFDEMGEQISNLWSPKNQQTFKSLLKMRSPSNGNDFMKRALKRFPKRNPRDLVNFYFNVYILRRMSQQTRLPSSKQVDTDDEDEVADFNYLGVKKKSQGMKLVIGNSKYIKR